jgi:hypothetical protein
MQGILGIFDTAHNAIGACVKERTKNPVIASSTWLQRMLSVGGVPHKGRSQLHDDIKIK